MSERYVGTTALIWPRFGPYHLARLDAAGQRFGREGRHVVGIEIARTDSTYGWNVAEGAASFERITIFSSAYDALSPRQIARAVYETLDRLTPSAVATVGWSFPEARAGLHWCWRNGRGAIVMSESKRDDAPRMWWKEWVKRRFIRRFDAALVGGTPHAEYAAELGIPVERVFLGHNAVDNAYFDKESRTARADAVRLRAELNLPEKFFLSVGRFVPKKNLYRLLEGYAAYRTRSPNPWGLVLCGGGELGNELVDLANRMKLVGVSWPGFTQVDLLPSFYGLASAFVLPSTVEQWGLVVNEAMASGLPVLVSRTAGCRYDLVEQGSNGFLFDPFHVEGIGRAMHQMADLSDDARQAMGQRSREIVGQWGPERFAEGLWQATCAALNARGARHSLATNFFVSFLAHPWMLRGKNSR